MNRTITVGLYARVSTEKQTTDNQLIRLREYAQRHDYVVFKEYVDIASGKLARRPALDEMLKDAKQKKFDKIIAVKIDRIGRNLTNLKNIVDDLVLWGVGLEMLDQPIDTSSASGRLMIDLLGAFAEFEREIIVERTKDGLERARRENKKLGRPKTVLSTYQIEKAKKIIEENPNISQRAFAKEFKGIGRKQLITLLAEQGIKVGGSKTVSGEVYIENPKSTLDTITSDCSTDTTTNNVVLQLYENKKIVTDPTESELSNCSTNTTANNVVLQLYENKKIVTDPTESELSDSESKGTIE